MCDTLGICSNQYNGNLFAKNSDRPIGESQPLVWIPEANHKDGETINCTGIEIPQVSHTYGVLGSKPYWIWGFEMGVNEKGVVIGNEAEFSRELGREEKDGLLGMDLLRLGLERGATAKEALTVIVDLLEQYGQNHNANKLFDARYDNSYLIMDSSEMWVLETAGRRFAAHRVTQTERYYALGNCYSLTDNFELSSEDIEEYARKNEWLMPYEKFNFAKAYSRQGESLTLAVPRRRRVMKLAGKVNDYNFSELKRIFRDHDEDELIKPYNGASTGVFPTVCRHALTWRASQTAASMLVKYSEGVGTVIRQAYSQPCCSVYIPVYPGVEMPEIMTTGGQEFNEKSLWWQCERLGKIIAIDYERFAPRVQESVKKLEAEIEQKAEIIEQKTYDKKFLSDFVSDSAFKALDLINQNYTSIKNELHKLGVKNICGAHNDFLNEYCSRTKMNLF